MNVVFFTHYTELYGANRSLLNLIDGLKIYQVNCHVILPRKGQIIPCLEARNIPFAIIPIECWVDMKKRQGNPLKRYYWATKRLYKNLKLFPQLIQQLQAWEIDLVYTNTAVLSVGLLVAKRLNIPHIWHIREFVDLDYNFKFDWGKKLFKYLAQNSAAIITISHSIYTHHFKNLAKKSIHVIYNGVAFQQVFDRLYENSQDYPFNKSQIYTFVLVGKIYPTKGQEIAIKALALLTKTNPNVRLILVGEGSKNYLTHLKNLTANLSLLDKVEFWDYLDDPYQAYWASDTVLMCSTNEGMGRVTVEAMAACRPVIGYNNAGTSEIIESEYTGLLYDGASEELALCMKKVLENPTWSQQLGKNGWKVAREKYCIEKYAKDIYDVLVSVQQ